MSQRRQRPAAATAEAADLPTTEQTDLACSVVRYLLNASISRLPIKKADIVQHCLHGDNRQFAGVYEIAAGMLRSNYGMSVYRVMGVKTSGVQFLCVSVAANPSAGSCLAADEQQTTMPVLFLVLAYIYMKGGQVGENSVFAFLEKCDLNVSTPTASSQSGDIRKLVLDTFCKQLYVKKSKQQTETSNEVRLMLEWGQRAELEFAKSDMLGAVAQLMNRPASSFAKQWEEVQTVEQQSEQAAGGEQDED